MGQTQNQSLDSESLRQLARQIKDWGVELGFQALAITDTDLTQAELHLNKWLTASYHGEMNWMTSHGKKRTHPTQLIPGTLRVISARMDYLPDCSEAWSILNDPDQAYVSRYALGRDYHKLMRKRLQQLAELICAQIGPFGHRVFVDSAPVMEKALAEKAGLGWIGKHTNLIQRDCGSWFFLGEVYVELPLPCEEPSPVNHCGTCTSCIDACPTRAIVAPYQLDARRCISYLTIELSGPIPVELRPLIGNRIYGCDDCQLVCPWNRFAQITHEADFNPRHHLDNIGLLEVFAWDGNEFLRKTEGSAIRRIGHERWQRNIAVALGNAVTSREIVQALRTQLSHASPLVREHIEWALARHDYEG